MSIAQIDTYRNPTNKLKRLTIEDEVLEFLKGNNNPYTINEMAIAMGTYYKRIQPRVSELHGAQKLIVTGTKKEGNITVTIYKLGTQVNMFRESRKTKLEVFKDACKRMVDPSQYDQINNEFERLNKINK